MAEVDYKTLLNQAKAYMSLKYDYSKLTVAEKLSVLLSRVVLLAIAILLGIGALLFISFALATALAEATQRAALAYCIVAGIWVLAGLLLYIFKTALVVNPVTRFVTKLMFNPKDEE